MYAHTCTHSHTHTLVYAPIHTYQEALISFNANTLLRDKIDRTADTLAPDSPVCVTLLQDASVTQREQQGFLLQCV